MIGHKLFEKHQIVQIINEELPALQIGDPANMVHWKSVSNTFKERIIQVYIITEHN